jgi:hypothetical protein
MSVKTLLSTRRFSIFVQAEEAPEPSQAADMAPSPVGTVSLATVEAVLEHAGKMAPVNAQIKMDKEPAHEPDWVWSPGNGLNMSAPYHQSPVVPAKMACPTSMLVHALDTRKTYWERPVTAAGIEDPVREVCKDLHAVLVALHQVRTDPEWSFGPVASAALGQAQAHINTVFAAVRAYQDVRDPMFLALMRTMAYELRGWPAHQFLERALGIELRAFEWAAWGQCGDFNYEARTADLAAREWLTALEFV